MLSNKLTECCGYPEDDLPRCKPLRTPSRQARGTTKKQETIFPSGFLIHAAPRLRSNLSKVGVENRRLRQSGKTVVNGNIEQQYSTIHNMKTDNEKFSIL